MGSLGSTMRYTVSCRAMLSDLLVVLLASLPGSCNERPWHTAGRRGSHRRALERLAAG